MPTYPFIDKGIAWTSDTIKCALVTDSYVFSDSHEFWDDVNADEASGTGYSAQTMTCTESYTAGVHTLDASDVTFSSISVSSIKYAVIYKDTGTASTSPLLFAFDVSDSGVSRTLVNADATLQFSALGVFQQRYT